MVGQLVNYPEKVLTAFFNRYAHRIEWEAGKVGYMQFGYLINSANKSVNKIEYIVPITHTYEEFLNAALGIISDKNPHTMKHPEKPDTDFVEAFILLDTDGPQLIYQ
tara:strand:- start:416 stop:736 length:321 start_codon:yes stop_codon:yes gene_type:complete